VSGAQTVSIDLTSGQLDDVLKSLTTVDLGGGQVTGITYNTEAPLGEQLRKLRLPLAPDVTRNALLEALTGTRVEVRAAGAIVSGRILSVDSQVRGKEETQRTVDDLTIVGEGGDLRTFELGPGVTVTLLDGELRRDLGQYLDVIGSARSQEVRRLQVAALFASLRIVASDIFQMQNGRRLGAHAPAQFGVVDQRLTIGRDHLFQFG
jgi:hypothetical protein